MSRLLSLAVLLLHCSLTQSRTAVLSEYFLTGIHNVRWETMTNNLMDADGKPVPSKVGGTKNADGTTTFGCVDVNGKNQAHGAEYERPNGRFKYRCNNGLEEVVACVGSERTNKARINVGETLDVNGLWHKCQSFPNGSYVYTQAPSCKYGEKEYAVGQEINVGFLRLQCGDKGYEVVGCFYTDEGGNIVKLEKGAQKEAGKQMHFCEEKEGTLQYYAKGNGCTKNGTDYKEGDEFSKNHFRYKCINGLADIVGCFIDEKRPLSVGQDVIEKNMVYRCYRLGPKVEYNEYACGLNGTPSCTPPKIPDTPDDAPALGRGLKTPGFATFAIAQKNGENMAVNPETLKLQLDKLMAAHSPA